VDEIERKWLQIILNERTYIAFQQTSAGSSRSTPSNGGGAVTTGGGSNYGASPRAPTGPQRQV
jgi:hypothetical protein